MPAPAMPDPLPKRPKVLRSRWLEHIRGVMDTPKSLNHFVEKLSHTKNPTASWDWHINPTENHKSRRNVGDLTPHPTLGCYWKLLGLRDSFAPTKWVFPDQL